MTAVPGGAGCEEEAERLRAARLRTSRFVHPERPPIILHQPHPALVLKRYQIEQILEFLKKEGGL